MQGEAPQQARRARGYYGGRWKKAKDAFHRITAISAKENKALLGLSGVAGHFNGVLRNLQVQGIVVPSSILHSLDVWVSTGVPHANDVHNHPDVAARVAALRDLELTMTSLDDWLRDTEVVLTRQ